MVLFSSKTASLFSLMYSVFWICWFLYNGIKISFLLLQRHQNLFRLVSALRALLLNDMVLSNLYTIFALKLSAHFL